MGVFWPPLYSVERLKGSGNGLPEYNFKVHLNRDVVLRVIGVPMDQSSEDRFSEIGRNTIKTYPCTENNPYSFFNDTHLVENIRLGSENRCLEVSPSQIEHFCSSDDSPFLTYLSVNSESARDRDVLLTLFSKWAESARSF